MLKSRRIIILFFLNFLITLISLISLLVPFYQEENRIKNNIISLSDNITTKINEDNATSYVEFVSSNFNNYELLIFSLDNNTFVTSLKDNYSSKDLTYFSINVNQVISMNDKSLLVNQGFAYISYNDDTNLYLVSVTSITDTYLTLETLSIIIPLLTSISLYTYWFIDYRKSKNETQYLKHQVRKLRSIAKIDTMVEYDNDVENLANILKDTRRKLDLELQNNFLSEKKLDFILNSIEQGILVLNVNHEVVISNQKAREILNFDKNIHRLLDEDLPKELSTNIRIVFSTFRKMIFNKEINGRIYEFIINPISEALENNPNKISVSILILDITEAYNSEKMKRDFFANAAHELKSPLTSILGFQELIKDGLLTTKDELVIANERTIKEGERMNKLIIEMLELSSLENNNLRTIEKIDVSEEIDKIVSMLDDQIKEKEIVVHKLYSKMIIKMNPDDFYNLFKNLIENSVRYNLPRGSIWIKIDNKNKFVSIKDNGIGISKENQQRIFERFFRVDKARSKQNGGTGLGLSIVKYICNYYDLDIKVISELDKGAEFIIYF